MALVPKALLCDFSFIYTPSQIALGCFYSAKTSALPIMDYLNERFLDRRDIESSKDSGLEQPLNKVEKLMKILKFISSELQTLSTIDKELAKILVISTFTDLGWKSRYLFF